MLEWNVYRTASSMIVIHSVTSVRHSFKDFQRDCDSVFVLSGIRSTRHSIQPLSGGGTLFISRLFVAAVGFTDVAVDLFTAVGEFQRKRH